MPGSQKLTPPSSASELSVEHAKKTKAKHTTTRRDRIGDRPDGLSPPIAAGKRITHRIEHPLSLADLLPGTTHKAKMRVTKFDARGIGADAQFVRPGEIGKLCGLSVTRLPRARV